MGPLSESCLRTGTRDGLYVYPNGQDFANIAGAWQMGHFRPEGGYQGVSLPYIAERPLRETFEDVNPLHISKPARG